MANSSIKLIAEQRRVDLSQDLPSLSLSANYGYENTDYESLTKDTSDYYNIGLSLKIPLFSGLSSLGKRREYAAKNIVAEKESLLAETDIKKEVIAAYTSLNTSLAILKSNQEWLTEANRAYKFASKSFSVGSIDTAQLLQIQQSKENAELSYVQTKMELYKKFIEFQYSVGENLLNLRL
jgi:outer membrane protein